MRLHIGSGPISIPGWTNVDIAGYPGVDVVMDIRHPWPFREADFIFAEHFLEHLSLSDGMAFAAACRGALRADGVLRISTPNLDWVWTTHYKPPDQLAEEEQLIGCLEINRAFHGWGHRFLYNKKTLGLVLHAAGFMNIVDCNYGESAIHELRNLERHERHRDLPSMPSVIVVEASGYTAPSLEFAQRIDVYLRDFGAQ